MSAFDALALLVGGIAAGFINSMAGGGSLLTVPLLALVGVDGLNANGTNRVAVAIQNLTSAYGYARGGVLKAKAAIPLVIPAVVGGAIGSLAISEVDDETFERIFGLLMIPLLVLVLVKPIGKGEAKPWPSWMASLALFGVGVYAGAIQAGVGLMLLFLLARMGNDLISANATKTLIILAVTALVAVPIFASKGEVSLLPAIVLSAGTGIGGYVGARSAVSAGERIVKPVLVVAVVALSGRMLGFYG